MDLAQHFEMDYDQILRKCPNKAKNNFCEIEQCEKPSHAFL